MLKENLKLKDFLSKEKLTSDLNGRKNNYIIYWFLTFTNCGDTPKILRRQYKK